IALLITLVVVVLLTPQPQDERVRVLDSRSSEAGGARMLHDLAARSGWPVRRRSGDVAGVLDSPVDHLVLEPARSIAATEIHALPELVRGGAGLVVVAPTSELRDSLWQAVGARIVEGSGYLSTGFETEAESCPAPLR